MNHFRLYTNIKLGLFFIALFLIFGLLTYSNSIVDQLRKENRQIVTIYSQIIAKTVNEDNDDNLNFVFDEIIKKIQFPIIYSDQDNKPILSRNIDVESLDDLLQPMKSMDSQNQPIAIAFNDSKSGNDIVLGYLHYGDSSLIRKLKWLPFLEIGIVAIFVIVGFIGFNSIRNNEKRNIWVGMARETAHQLGTPISALMGWVDILKDHPDDAKSLIAEIQADVDRLDQIGD